MADPNVNAPNQGPPLTKDPDPPPVFVLGDRLGKGSFATVYKGQLVATKQLVAIKVVLRAHLSRDKRLYDNFEAELAILKDIKHPHIVSFYEVVKTKLDYNLVIEYCSLGDLSYFIRKKKHLVKTLPLAASLFQRYPSPANSAGLNETITRHFMCQIASALRFLRANDLVHRDIKPQNLLLKPPASSAREYTSNGYVGLWELPVLKLADFGFARFLPQASLAETLCGSPLYMAPEILHYEKYNAKADLWSLGAVAYEMTVGKPPFPAANHLDLIKKIDAGKDRIEFGASASVSRELKTLIRGLLKRSPSERMGFEELFKSPALEVRGHEKPLDLSRLDSKVHISEYLNESHTSTPSPGPASPAAPGPFRVAPSRTPQRRSSVASNSEAVPVAGVGRLALEPSGTASLDKDYVVVEKRMVEVNALADDLATGNPRSSPASAESGTSQGSGARAMRRPERKRMLSSVVYGASPSNALAQALIKSSARLFGTKVESGEVAVSASEVPKFLKYKSPQTATEKQLVLALERLSTMGKVVLVFADVKLAQLEGDRFKGAAEVDPTLEEVLAQEALALYLKALSLLAAAMNLASEWWQLNETGVASHALNDLVQWIRDKFNDAMDHAETCRSYILNGHASPQSSVEMPSSSLGPPSLVSVEKLLFDRALEMARAAAVQELRTDDLATCEMNYGTAYWMLHALSERTEAETPLADLEAELVDKLKAQISQRLRVLGKRIEVTPPSKAGSPVTSP